MKHFIGVTLTAALVGAVIGPKGPLGGFWAPAHEAARPHGTLLARFIAEGIVENLAFGVGVSILLLGRRWFTARIATTRRATTAWLASAWLFASWMPHAALHLHIGMRPAQLLPIEWIFHVGAIAAIAALLWAAVSTGTYPPTRHTASPSAKLALPH
jgi:hypothetical protein